MWEYRKHSETPLAEKQSCENRSEPNFAVFEKFFGSTGQYQDSQGSCNVSVYSFCENSGVIIMGGTSFVDKVEIDQTV